MASLSDVIRSKDCKDAGSTPSTAKKYFAPEASSKNRIAFHVYLLVQRAKPYGTTFQEKNSKSLESKNRHVPIVSIVRIFNFVSSARFLFLTLSLALILSFVLVVSFSFSFLSA